MGNPLYLLILVFFAVNLFFNSSITSFNSFFLIIYLSSGSLISLFPLPPISHFSFFSSGLISVLRFVISSSIRLIHYGSPSLSFWTFSVLLIPWFCIILYCVIWHYVIMLFVCHFYFTFWNVDLIWLRLLLYLFYRGNLLSQNLSVKIKFHSFYSQDFFTGISFKCSFTCFCYYFYWISVLVFWLDFRIYYRAHYVFEIVYLVSFLAKFIGGCLELRKE